MITLKEAAEMFAKLDEISAGDFAAYDKSLRDISQRFYLPSSGTSGRAALYDEAQVCGLRIIQVAYGFQIPRERLNLLALYMFGNFGRTKKRVIDEAVVRAGNQETFEFHIEMHRSRDFVVTSNWKSGSSSKADRVLKSVKDQNPSDASLCVPASRLILEVLNLMALESRAR